MRRIVLIGGAWLLATGVSVFVAHAAVGEVRDRVVDRPQPLTAVLAEATSTAPPDTAIATTTADSVPAVAPAETSPVTEAPVVTTPTTSPVTTSATAPTDGRIETYSTPGGSVSIEIFSDHLTLLGAVPAAGFSVAEQEISPTQMEIEFSGEGEEVKFKAKLEGGEVLVTVEIEGRD